MAEEKGSLYNLQRALYRLQSTIAYIRMGMLPTARLELGATATSLASAVRDLPNFADRLKEEQNELSNQLNRLDLQALKSFWNEVEVTVVNEILEELEKMKGRLVTILKQAYAGGAR